MAQKERLRSGKKTPPPQTAMPQGQTNELTIAFFKSVNLKGDGFS